MIHFVEKISINGKVMINYSYDGYGRGKNISQNLNITYFDCDEDHEDICYLFYPSLHRMTKTPCPLNFHIFHDWFGLV